MADYIRGTRCTVERRNGKFCDKPAAPDVPFPICEPHALQLVRLRPLDSWLPMSVSEVPDPPSPEPVALPGLEPVVYYVELVGVGVKIGYTRQRVAKRVTQLRAGELLATEPGDNQLELMRHKQFAHLRIGKREDFRDAPDLRSHIDMLLQHHGGLYKQKPLKRIKVA